MSRAPVSEIERLHRLRDDGDAAGFVAAAVALATAYPTDVTAQIEAAYANDRYGEELDAIRYYDAAWALGVPADRERRFLVGYGSTLRNVGRLDRAVGVLTDAVARYPEYPPLHAFLALALHSSGDAAAATATAIDALVIATAGTDRLDGYDRALRYYRDELRGDPRAG